MPVDGQRAGISWVTMGVAMKVLWMAAVLFLGAGTLQAAENKTESATFAGGCFWCMEQAMDQVVGVISTTSGYIGGHKDNPSYREVSAGVTGHTEAVQVVFDPTKVSYDDLLKAFWLNIDPTVRNRQFCDRGSQYRSGIFYHDEAQKKAAEASLAQITRIKPFKEAIVTEITAAGTFYPAESYHQDYYLKNPIRYKFYKYNCGRAQRLEALWGPTNH